MYAAERRAEVEPIRPFFEKQGYAVHELPHSVQAFEGMGDACWHTGRALLWGGYGFRTERAAYRHIATFLDVPVLLLHLTDPDFYHLDTCLSILDERTALICPEAFEPDGLSLIETMFETVLRAPEDEARHGFACNAHCPDQHHVIIHHDCHATCTLLRQAGFEPIPVDTGEFFKAGGSVFCMKQMFF